MELPDWARGLDSSRHPEGGWYSETWRSDVEIIVSCIVSPGFDFGDFAQESDGR